MIGVATLGKLKKPKSRDFGFSLRVAGCWALALAVNDPVLRKSLFGHVL